METKKDSKKGFWASLFSPKPCSCACDTENKVSEKPDSTSCSGEKSSSAPQTGIREIKILGPGCAKCKTTYQAIAQVVNENNLDVKLTKIEDIVEIMSYNVMETPAVVVDGTVVIKGHIPSESEIKQILGI